MDYFIEKEIVSEISHETIRYLLQEKGIQGNKATEYKRKLTRVIELYVEEIGTLGVKEYGGGEWEEKTRKSKSL